jgi:CRISPR-associated protein Cas5t
MTNFGVTSVKCKVCFAPELFLYLPDLNFADYFKTPSYPLLLGRSTELVAVKKIETIELVAKENVRVGGSIFPFSPSLKLTGKLQALPTHFTDEMPRQAVGTQPFCLVETDFSGRSLNLRPQVYAEEIYCDTEKDWGIYFYGGSFSEK